MRTIKFRGKRVDNGRWVYGFFVKDELGNYLIIDGEYSVDEGLDQEHVIEETVGQFTGLLDKNGKQIYEGDLLSAWRLGFNKIFEIKWRAEGEPKYILYPQPFNEDLWTCRSDMRMSWEVIGNIHDNKEIK